MVQGSNFTWEGFLTMMLKGRLKQHIRDNRWQYLLIMLLFAAGLLFGNYKVPGLEGGVKNHLLELLNKYLLAENQENLNGSVLMFYAFVNQAKSIVLIWFLGLTVIGMPIILAVLFLKGFSLGFTVGFLVQEKAGAGVLITVLSIIPQNLVYIPLLIIWAVVGMNFSISIAAGRHNHTGSFGRNLAAYTMMMLVFLVLVLVGAFIEAYFSPWLLQSFIK